MGMTLEALLPRLEFACGIEDAIRREIHRDPERIRALAAEAYQGEAFDFRLRASGPLTRLAVVTWLLTEKYDAYRAKGMSDAAVFETFKDVSLRAGLYRNRNGEAGLSEDDVIWFRHIMNAGIFKFDALQFQPLEMIYLDEETIGEPYMTFTREQKELLPAGSPVINCHIQRGADLNAPLVSRSLEEAERFFAEGFSDAPFRAFFCASWMLYPPMVARLPADSRIRQFAERFTVIGYCADAEQALENLFDGGREPPAGGTSLQRMALEHPERFGFACGMIEL